MGETKEIEESSSSSIIGYFLVALILLSLGGGAWLLYSEYKRQNTMPGINGASSSSSATPSTVGNALDTVVQKVKDAAHVITTPKSSFPLTQGSKGNEVKYLQQYLNVRWKTSLAEDGIWGAKTTSALSQYENTNSVTAAEYDKLKSWLDTFPHDFTSTIKPKDVVINQNTQDQYL